MTVVNRDSELLLDPDGEPVLAPALAAGAECIISLNTRDFPAGVQSLPVPPE